MKKVNFDVKLPAFVDRIVYVDNYGARPYCYTIEDASRNADAINRAINYISEKGGGTVVIPEGIWFTAPIEIKSDVELMQYLNFLKILTSIHLLSLTMKVRSV